MPMSGRHRHLRAYIWFVLVLLLGGLVVAILNITLFRESAPAQTSLQPYPSDLPPLTVDQSIGNAASFDALVQDTPSGFQPSILTVTKGNTVRFTNTLNETVALKITGISTTTLTYGAYVQQTFSKAGTYTFTDGATKGTLTVQ